MDSKHNAPEQRTIDVDVQDVDTRGRTLHGYAAVYNVESRDLGGFRERIAPGAFSGVLDADVRALLNHDPNEVLGRTKAGTLRLFDEQRGLRFECDLPDSPLGENVRAAVKRGDIDGASFRFVVGDELWDDDLRTVQTVKELHDVTVATYGAYPDASVELRTRPATTSTTTAADERQKESDMSQDVNEERNDVPEKKDEVRVVSEPDPVLQVESRMGPTAPLSAYEAFRAKGFPGEQATIAFGEFRTASFGGTIDALNRVQQGGGELGFDRRWAYPAFAQQSVTAGATSIQVLQQSSRTVPAGTAVIRDIDAVTTKPEVTTVTNVVNVPLKQVAAVETNIPNVLLEQDAIESVVEVDLRLAIDGGLDQLVKAAVDASGFQAPGTDPLPTSVRKAMTTIQNNGYNPDTLLLTPTAAETLDTLVSGTSGATADYVFGPGNPAGQLFGLNARVSKVIAASVVVDSRAFGKLYASPATLARFEADSGTTNRSNVRLELHAAFGTERQNAAVRIAGS